MERDFSKEVYHRIVNKTKDYVTVIMNTGINKREPVKMPWDEFNKIFIIVDGFKAYPTEEQKEKADKIERKVNLLCIYLMESQASSFESRSGEEKLKVMASIGSLSRSIQEELGCTMLDLMQVCRSRISAFKKSINEENSKRPSRFKRSHTKNEQRNTETYTPSATQTLGDIPGMDKLREKFNK